MPPIPPPEDISSILVTPSNPASSDTTTLDYVRCAKLHNWLVQHARNALGHGPLEQSSYLSLYREEAETLSIRDRLQPDLVSFLESIVVDEKVPFYFWVELLSPPSLLFPENMFWGDDTLEEDQIVMLYLTNNGLGSHDAGLLYDQHRRRATLCLGIEDFEFVFSVVEHEDLWVPLERVLGNWVEMVILGKVVAEPERDEGEQRGLSKLRFGPWGWKSHAEGQVEGAVRAYERLVGSIEARMPGREGEEEEERERLFGEEVFKDAGVVRGSFIWKFLERVQRPKFNKIAPGLVVPRDPAVFVSRQIFTRMVERRDVGEEGKAKEVIPPALIFMAEDESQTASFDTDQEWKGINPFLVPFQKGLAKGTRVPVGVYSESVEVTGFDNAEEGFRLILPFSVGGGEGETQARKSDGGLIEWDSVADLFQHGFKPFGGEWYRAQRLERLLDRWRELVEKGVWTVGPDGVEGGLEKFKDAMGEGWRDYWIEPDW
ncbi:hypothetical protein QBC35DRAFT_515429 [Podospora australis]|uniref:Uncharacterized protein n=1 Tax=Podospora australis TaxID=1536484 RepID=A0AAN7AJ54_9PEZI|nr:hypothetical protein QBC35DRAFT_515429 [Podospora australis]